MLVALVLGHPASQAQLRTSHCLSYVSPIIGPTEVRGETWRLLGVTNQSLHQDKKSCRIDPFLWWSSTTSYGANRKEGFIRGWLADSINLRMDMVWG